MSVQPLYRAGIRIESALAPFELRPHWGKLFTMSPEAIRSSYEKLPQFAALLERHDPFGKFRNAFLSWYVFAGGSRSDDAATR